MHILAGLSEKNGWNIILGYSKIYNINGNAKKYKILKMNTAVKNACLSVCVCYLLKRRERERAVTIEVQGTKDQWLWSADQKSLTNYLLHCIVEIPCKTWWEARGDLKRKGKDYYSLNLMKVKEFEKAMVKVRTFFQGLKRFLRTQLLIIRSKS